MDFYGGCMYCDKAVDCQIAGEPDDDCPVEALIKAKVEFKIAVMENKLVKAQIWILNKLEAVLEKLRLR